MEELDWDFLAYFGLDMMRLRFSIDPFDVINHRISGLIQLELEQGYVKDQGRFNRQALKAVLIKMIDHLSGFPPSLTVDIDDEDHVPFRASITAVVFDTIVEHVKELPQLIFGTRSCLFGPAVIDMFARKYPQFDRVEFITRALYEGHELALTLMFNMIGRHYKELSFTGLETCDRSMLNALSQLIIDSSRLRVLQLNFVNDSYPVALNDALTANKTIWECELKHSALARNKLIFKTIQQCALLAFKLNEAPAMSTKLDRNVLRLIAKMVFEFRYDKSWLDFLELYVSAQN